MNGLRHINAPQCLACDKKLLEVVPDLRRWVQILRSTHPDAHVSCGHRGAADQEAAYESGNSRAHYGESAHNVLPSMAVDLFRLTQAGGAEFDSAWYKYTIAPIIQAAGLIWGGDWHSIKDMPHVEMPGFKPFRTT